MSNERAVITRTAENEHLSAVEGVGDHQPQWGVSMLVCLWCEEVWPCSTVEAVIVELEAQADGLCCGHILRGRIEQLRGLEVSR